MKFNYVSRDVALSPSMKQAVEEKLLRFEKYFKSESRLQATIKITILPNGKKGVECSLESKDASLRAKVIAEDFYSALDILVEKLDGQVRKVKTQIKKAHKENIYQELISEGQDEVENVDTIVKRKRLNLSPMDVEEALVRMDALGHEFFIYLDSTTGLVSVLYQRDDDKYGLIEVEK